MMQPQKNSSLSPGFRFAIAMKKKAVHLYTEKKDQQRTGKVKKVEKVCADYWIRDTAAVENTFITTKEGIDPGAGRLH
jgi:hypothetical protein